MLVNGEELMSYMGGMVLETEVFNFVEGVILPGVQQELENYLNRPVEPIQVREPRQPDSEGNVVLTVSPVWKILDIDYMGQSHQVPDAYLPPGLSPIHPVAERIFDISEFEQTATAWMQPISPIINIFTWSPIYNYGINPRIPPYVVMNYVGGLRGYTIAGLKLAMLRVAAREVERNLDDTLSLRAGSAEIATYSDQREKGWTDAELHAWSRYRRPVVA